LIKIGNSLNQEKVLPLTMSFSRVPLEIEVPTQPLYGRDGAVVTGKPYLQPRQFILQGSIYHPNKSQIVQTLDALLAFLMHTPLKVYRQHYLNRYLLSYPMGAPQDWVDAGAELQLRIPMIAYDPYWYGPAAMHIFSQSWIINIDSTAPALPVIETTSSVNSLTVTNQTTGDEVVVSGANGVIVVDNVNHIVTIDDDNRLDLVNDEWLLYGFKLVPGDNIISTSQEIKITYRHRYY